VDKENNIWVGTQGGLSYLKFHNNEINNPEITNYYQSEDSKKALSHNSIYDILIDKNDNVWLGTRLGLNLFLGNNEFDSWKDQTLLHNNIVYSIQDDEQGNLWLGTNEGIINFNSENNTFNKYGIDDGIQSNEFDVHAKFRDEEGIIYLGGISGLTYFHPRDLDSIDSYKHLYFSQLRINDHIVKPNNSSQGILTQSIYKTKKLIFKHNQFPFYLKFSSIDFRLNKDVNYAFKLLPSDTDWNPLKDPEIQFLNLPSGKYTLQINGFSRGKEWSQEPLEIEIEVKSPWWAQWWAYIIYLAIAIAFADRFYRSQLSKKLAVSESKRLKEINQVKNTLITNITHEFRTPLSVIKGMTDSIKINLENKQLDDLENSLEMIDRNSDALLHLVNEMLDLAKIESGNMELHLTQADVIPFVKYLGESFHSLAEEKKINLMVYSEIDELVMDFDANKLSVIISNVLSNAIKFTQFGGKVIVHLNQINNSKHKFFLIKIKDNGLGIPEKEVNNIFNRFYQVDNSSSRRGEGTGIGLTLCKEFVVLMNGSIEVKSSLGKGSEFIIQLPIYNRATLTIDVQIQQEPNLKAPTPVEEFAEVVSEDESELPLALIIEDNADVTHYLRTCLSGKYQTIHAANGEIGIETAFEKIPNIIICDVMMPIKDGFEVCSTLKSDERTDHIPIILLTAKVAMEDKLTGLSCGADAYLTKPFVKAELLTRLDQLVLLRKKIMQKIDNDSLGNLLKKRAVDPETKFLQKIIKVIHEEISNHSFGSSVHLSRKLLLSESQIYRKLKAITGKSTAVFIRSVRLQKAKEMIQTTDKTISEVAYEVGFNDPSWFSRAFKEEFGFAPSAMSKS
jgi:signal transduction histidine kinase/DNA-binding response OmpR family regulator